jgi:hypothetical protein
VTDSEPSLNPLGVPTALDDWSSLLDCVASYAPAEWLVPARRSLGLAASIGPEALTDLTTNLTYSLHPARAHPTVPAVGVTLAPGA